MAPPPRRSRCALAAASPWTAACWCSLLLLGSSATLDASLADPAAGADADDECASGAEDACAFSALQISASPASLVSTAAGAAGAAARQGRRASSKASARVARIARHSGVELKSGFFVGSGVSPMVSCKSSALTDAEGDGPVASLQSGYGAGGGGASWTFNALVIEGGPDLAKANLSAGVKLHLQVSAQDAMWELSRCALNVDGINKNLSEEPLNVSIRGTDDCPPAACLIPQPSGSDLPERVSAPACGFSEVPADTVSETGPEPGEKLDLEFDVTHLVEANFMSFKVWASPLNLLRNGFWQIPNLSVTSWGLSWTPSEKGMRF